MREIWAKAIGGRGWNIAARCVVAAMFLGLIGRFWHPHYGFTALLQVDPEAGRQMMAELRGAPIFVHSSPGSYDGVSYAQLATRPAVNDAQLDEAVDHVPYRARRMLTSWLAWLAGRGDAVKAVHAYAALNVFAWLALAAVLWRILPARGWRETAAWTGVLFSAGALASVRFALTDLPALGLIALGVHAAERGRRTGAIGWLAAATLTRETSVLAAVSLWPDDVRAKPGRALLATALVALPFGVWLAYLQWRLGPDNPGWSNLTWPATGFVGKWREDFAALVSGREPLLAVCSLLAQLGLVVQVAFLVWRREVRDGWWRLGAVFAGLMFFLGAAVWEGQPGAATRVLLPLLLAFNVRAARENAGVAWFVLGNLPVCAGLLALGHVPVNDREVAAGTFSAGSYVAHTDASWYPAESRRGKFWAWSPTGGALALDTWPRRDGPRRVAIALRTFAPHEIEIRTGATVQWRGVVGVRAQWIELPAVLARDGRAQLDLRSLAPPARESDAPNARELGVAICGLQVLD